MDSIYHLRYRDVLMLCVFALLALGVLMVHSAASGVTGNIGWHWSTTGTRDAMYVGAAIVAFFVCGFTNYRFWCGSRKESDPSAANPTRAAGFFTPVMSIPEIIRQAMRTPAFWAFAAGVFFCLITLIPHIGKEVNGSRRWIQLGPIQLQSSELGKWGCVLLYSWMLAKMPDILKKLPGFVLAMAPLGVVGILIVKEDFGTAALIGLCTLAVVIVGGARLWHIALILPPLGAGAYYFVTKEAYRMQRITAFMDPFATAKKEGYHLIQSLLSYASGGVLGTGLGNGVQKLGYLPEDTTDFIFAIICEELGLAGAALTVLLYLGIIWSCWNILKQCRDPFGKLLAFSVACMIGMQAMLNIAVATVSVPPKGLPLPLISFGGTGLVITSAMLGLVYNVARQWEGRGEELPLAAGKPSATIA